MIKPGGNEGLKISDAIKIRVWMDGWPMVEFVPFGLGYGSGLLRFFGLSCLISSK
jgi:hypothetical protein